MWLQEVAYHTSNLKEDDEHCKPFSPSKVTVCRSVDTASHEYKSKVNHTLPESLSKGP